MHLDDERAERLLHRELAPPDEFAARAHLAECPDCRAAFDRRVRDEDRILASLKWLDHPPTAVAPGAVIARASAERPEWRRWAAGLVVAIGLAGAAYAMTSSPVRRWLESVRAKPDSVPAPVLPPPATSIGGIAVDPGTDLVITFAAADSASRVTVRLTEGAAVEVRGPTGAATYTAEAGRILVKPAGGPIGFEVDLPAAAPRVEIRVGTKRLFLKNGDHLWGEGQLDWTGTPFVLPFGESLPPAR